MSTNFDLIFKSTAAERYDTDQNRRVEAILDAESVEIVEIYGGTMMGTDDPLPSENGYVIATDEITARRIAKRIEAAVGHPVIVTVEKD